MLIKHYALDFAPPKALPAVYCLLAEDPFQLDTIARAIISSWRARHAADETELKKMSLLNTADWSDLQQEANHYSLFAQFTLIDAHYDKKSLDASAKKTLEAYLQNSNPDCLMLLRMPNIPLKQIQAFANQANIQIIYAKPPAPAAIKKWIMQKIQASGIRAEAGIADLILYYTEGNLLACVQVFEKLPLMVETNNVLSVEQLKGHLSNQCQFVLFDLAETCLRGDSDKALRLLRQNQADKNEISLVLWIITQEIRVLLQLQQLLQQSVSWQNACTQAKVWSTKAALYQQAIKKYDMQLLQHWLLHCAELDKRIKSSQSKRVWQAIETLALSLCTGKQVAYLG